jgi:periplasmic divalent cation tolerance protein
LSAAADFDVVLVLTTIGGDADAIALARTLVDERLAACVNVLPLMTSVYRWQGRIEEDQERQIVIKTARRRIGALEQRLRQLHPYELPEFLVLSASGGSEGYLRWVGECTVADAGSG